MMRRLLSPNFPDTLAGSLDNSLPIVGAFLSNLSGTALGEIT